MKVAVFMVILIVTGDIAYGRVFEFCELARELDRQGFPRWQLDDWLCLIDAESEYKTDAFGNLNDGESYDFGLFQISSIYWCKYHTPKYGYNYCNIDCNDLLSDDITDASKCAKLIHRQQGFAAWVGWKNKCKNKIKKPTDKCFLVSYKDPSPFRFQPNIDKNS